MSKILHFGLGMMVFMIFLADTVASPARKPPKLTNEPKRGAELGTGRVPGSSSRVPEEKRKPIVKRLDDDVFEAFSVCLEAWFNVSPGIGSFE